MATSPPAVGLLAVCCLAGVLAACAPGARPELPVVQRWIEGPEGSEFRADQLVESNEIVRWSFHQGLDPWTVSAAADETTIGRQGLEIRPAKRFVTLERWLGVDAGTVDAFEVKIRGAGRFPVAVEWTVEGLRFDDRRRVEDPYGRRTDDGASVFRLVVGGHPEWTGRIQKVRISFVVARNTTGVVEWVRTMGYEIDSAAVEDVLARPWKVDIGNDVRTARLAWPGRMLEWKVDVGRDAVLDVAYGLTEGARSQATFRVEAVDRGGAVRTLLRDPVASGYGRWREATVDLPRGTVAVRLRTEADGDFDGRFGLPAWAGVTAVEPGRTRPPDVVVISIDTLRADHLSLYGYTRSTTPLLDEWASRNALVFERAVASAPWTLPSHVSMFSGIDSHRHGVNFEAGAPAQMTMMAEVFRSAGYETVAVTGGGFVHPRFGFAQGFDSYGTHGVQMADRGELEDGLRRALEVVDRKRARPLFLFFHTYEVHNPFTARQPWADEFRRGTEAPVDGVVDVLVETPRADDGFRARRSLVVYQDDRRVELPTDAVERMAIDLYDSEIAFTDQTVGQLLARYDVQGGDAHSVVVFTSDHGELFGEHGLYNHVSLYEENLRVPMVVAVPSREGAGVRVGSQVRSVDILPTVLELSGLPVPTGIDGRSMVPLATGVGEVGDRTAFSYASASNFGFSICDPSGPLYIVRNDPWRAEGPREELWPGDEAPAGGPDGHAAVAAFRRTASAELSAHLNGTRVRFLNLRGDAAWNVSMTGPAVGPVRLKVVDPLPLAPAASVGNHVEFRVEAGDDLTLVLEGLDAREFTVRVDVDAPGAGGGQLAVVPEDLVGPLALLEEADGWRRSVAGDRRDADGVHVWWSAAWAPGAGDASSDEAASEEVRAQLEALGYVQ